MKTLEQYQKFADDLKALCQQHGIFIVGTCNLEGVYGEITLGEYGNPDSYCWGEAETQTKFQVDKDISNTIIMR